MIDQQEIAAAIKRVRRSFPGDPDIAIVCDALERHVSGFDRHKYQREYHRDFRQARKMGITVVQYRALQEKKNAKQRNGS